MAQKFIGLDEAAEKLGGAKDQLNALREAGKLRGYRDGASWKFRLDEIEELIASGGLAAAAADSGIDELDAMSAGLDSGSLDLSDDLDLDLGSLEMSDDLTGDAEAPSIELSPESDLELAAVDEPTTPAEEEPAAGDGDDALVLDTEPSSSDAESILLTDESVGGASNRPPSTIIGKGDAAAEDADLELAPDSGAGPATSDVKLIDDKDDLSGLSSLGESPSEAASKKFEGLEELEIDLEAESSRILESKDLEAARAAAKGPGDATNDDSRPEIDALESDLALASGSDAASLTGLSKLGGDADGGFELAPDSSLVLPSDASPTDPSEEPKPGSSAVLSEDANDDFVLGGDGSDITLSGADSGINLTPADSGIALDDASLNLSGAGSSLDLSESFGAALTDGGEEEGIVSGEQDFMLQPVADESDTEDSSQIIALEEVVEEEEDDVMISDDVGAFDMTEDPAAAATPAGVVSSVESVQFDMWAMLFLSTAVLTMSVCAIMSVDMIRTIWSWNEPSPISSSILESVANLWGYRT